MQRRAFCGRSNTMLDRDFAEKFIDRVTRYTDYNVNIMDERGIIPEHIATSCSFLCAVSTKKRAFFSSA